MGWPGRCGTTCGTLDAKSAGPPRRARELAAVAVAKAQSLQIDGLGLRVATRQRGGDVGEELDLASKEGKLSMLGMEALVQTRVTFCESNWAIAIGLVSFG